MYITLVTLNIDEKTHTKNTIGLLYVKLFSLVSVSLLHLSVSLDLLPSLACVLFLAVGMVTDPSSLMGFFFVCHGNAFWLSVISIAHAGTGTCLQLLCLLTWSTPAIKSY